MDRAYNELLKKHGLSLTSVRLAVLEALDMHPHADANLIFDTVQTRIETASKQAIYNNLNTLVEHGIVREIKPKGHAALYETRTDDNHHHLVCRKCNLVMDADCLGAAPPCLKPVDTFGFKIDEAEVIFWGTCPSCQRSRSKIRERK
jgi:Fur family ferric uptake transcriptional regulator